MRISRWSLGPALALTLSLAMVPAVGEASPAKPDPTLTATSLAKPSVKLDGPQHGKAALKALGSKLGAAASLNRKTSKQLHDVLANDPTAWLNQNGRLFYADRFERPNVSARTSTTTSVPPAPEPLADTFKLHSIEGGADHTVYLDFNGVYLGPNNEWIGGGWKVGTYKGFSLDSDYSTFSSAERAYIQHVWQVVAEKYAPFDIDVTTEDPGAAAYNRAGAGDATYGDHVVFTDVTTGSGAKPADVCPYGCDGISLNSSFDDPSDNGNHDEPTWIYTHDYHWYEGLSGEIAAHEIGHTLGLEHDGLGTGDGDYGSGNDAYYTGNDQWSPVMGAGSGALIQFSKGEYANASNTEDDFAVMQNHGVGLRPDDWGDTGSPSALGQAVKYDVHGVLEDAADKDVFTINRTCTTPLEVRAAGIGDGQTADLQLRVLDATGTTVLGSDDPAASFNESTYPRGPRGVDAEVSLPSTALGLIQVEVDGVGFGDPSTDGYSDYGSVGTYELTISGCGGIVGTTPGAPGSLNAVQASKSMSMTVSWAAPSDTGEGAITGYRVSGLPSGTVDLPASQTSEVFTGLEPGRDYDVTVQALNAYGVGKPAQLTKHMATWTPSTAPKFSGSAKSQTVTLDWTEPANPGRAAGTFWTVSVYYGGKKLQSFQSDYGYTGLRITGVHPARYKFTAYLNYDADLGTHSPSASTYVDVGPSAPRIGTASSGATGGAVNATARWGAPSTLRGCKITAYYVIAYQLDSNNHVIGGKASNARSGSSRSYTFALPKGKFKFRVQAAACGGYTDVSGYSNIVFSR